MTTTTNPQESKELPISDIPTPKCKCCASTDIFRDNLACQSLFTKEVIIMPIFICKNCAAGILLADNFKPFVSKVLEKIGANPIPPTYNEPKKDQDTTPLS